MATPHLMNTIKSLRNIFPLAILISGCTMGPHYHPPVCDVPCEWSSPHSQEMSAQSPDCFLWWKALNDPTLDSLMKRASMQNLDLHIAATRIVESRTAIKGKSRDLYPHVDGSVVAGQLSFSRKNLINDLLCNSCNTGRRRVSFFEAGFDAEWELDLFGYVAHEVCAAEADAEAAEESLLDIWVTLSAEVARNYIELRGLQQREQIYIQEIDIQRSILCLNEGLLQAGFANTLVVNQAEEELALLQSQLLLVQPGINRAIYRLSILLGYQPGELLCELSTMQELPHLPCNRPIGMPSELLRRRPDIRRAERHLAAATERIGSAIASLFPRFSLSGFVGNISTQLSSLKHPSAATYFIAPKMLLPIFNSNMTTEDIGLSKTQAQQALYIYQKTILEALEEAENAVASLHYTQQQQWLLNSTTTRQREIDTLTSDLYQRGVRDQREKLTAHRLLLQAEDAEIQGEVALLTQYIALYKALGGGWELARECP